MNNAQIDWKEYPYRSRRARMAAKAAQAVHVTAALFVVATGAVLILVLLNLGGVK